MGRIPNFRRLRARSTEEQMLATMLVAGLVFAVVSLVAFLRPGGSSSAAARGPEQNAVANTKALDGSSGRRTRTSHTSTSSGTVAPEPTDLTQKLQGLFASVLSPLGFTTSLPHLDPAPAGSVAIQPVASPGAPTGFPTSFPALPGKLPPPVSLPPVTDTLPPTTDTLPPPTTVPPTTLPPTTLPPTTDTLPPTTDTLPPTTDTLPPTTDTLPPTTDTLPPTTDTLPPTTDTLPPTTDTLPPTTDTLPATTLPPTTDTLPLPVP
jgi:hypothetical protein